MRKLGRVVHGRLVLDDGNVIGVLVLEFALEVELALEVDEHGRSFPLVHSRDVVRPRRDGQSAGATRANLENGYLKWTLKIDI